MISEMKVEYGYVKNTGNYESERLFVGVTMTVGVVPDPQVIMDEELGKLKAFVHEKLGLVKAEIPTQKLYPETDEQLPSLPRRRRLS
jgi:hypothetical protein